MEKGTKVQVLDHGYVTYINSMGNDEEIVEAARMSTGKGFISWDPYERCDACGQVFHLHEEQKLKDFGHLTCSGHKMVKYPNGDLGLLDTLWRKKHATPFEMGELVIEVQAPIMVFREWHRHRTQSYNEFSARYAVMPNLHYLPEASRIQKQSSANKQGSAEAVSDDTASQVRAELAREQEEIYGYYEGWAESGIAKEVARINTPVSRYSKMRAKGNIRNWFQFLNLRMRPDAQWEIRMFANEVGAILKALWPKAFGFFEEYDLYGAHLSRTELRTLRKMIHDIDGALPENCELTGTKLKEFLAKLKDGGDKILS